MKSYLPIQKMTYRKAINETVDKMHHSKLITDFESEKMKEGNRTPCFYGLPKLHNPFSTFPTLRPICSGSNSCTVRIFEFADHFLKPIAQRSFSYVKDTTAFINKLENTQIKNLNNATLVSMDVNSLYPNIDHKEGAEACYEYFLQYDISPLLSKFLLGLIYLVLKYNTLSFGSRFFHQIKGTAMGTPMAVNFANLFMTKFESEMLRDFEAANGIRPAFWLRYIDDIFFIWTEDDSSLKRFIEFVRTYSKSKQMKSDITFEIVQNKSGVVFLDTRVKLSGNKLSTTLHSKPTSAHLYLRKNSYHPFSLVKSIPKSQFIRIKRICTSLNDYWYNAKQYVQYFVARGFKESKLIDNAKAVSKLERQQLLNPALYSAKTCTRIPFVLTWHHKFHGIGKILHQNYFEMIKDHPHLKSTFPEPPLLSFRRNKNLKDILVHSSLQYFTQYNKTVPCNHQSCLLCQSMSNTDTVKNPKSGLSFKTKGGNCCKSNIVYAAECTKHNQLCIGFSTRELHLRFNNHRSEINCGKITCELVKHFHDNGCDFRKDLRVYILEDNLPLSKTCCELREDHRILKLKTKEPFGMNSYVNSLAKSFYELF